MSRLNNISYYLFSLIPIFFVSGPFLIDLSFFLLTIIFLINLKKEKNFNYLNNNYFWFMIVFFCYIIFNSLLNLDNIGKNNYYFYFRFILYAFTVSYFLKDIKFIETFIFYSVVIIFLFTADSFLAKFYGTGLFSISHFNKYRLSSFFYDELIMGSFFLRLLIILNPLYLFLYKSKKSLIFLLFLNIVGMFLIILSGERASLFLFLIYIFLNSLILNFNIKKKIAIFSVLSSIVIIFLIFSPEIRERFIIQTFLQEENFLGNHIDLFKVSLKMFETSPIFGNGYRSFQFLCYDEQFYINGKQFCSTHPHNIYLQLLAELGIIGFIFIMTIFLFFFYQFLRSLYYSFIKMQYIHSNSLNFCITGIMINIFPLTTSGNFFHNWLNCLYFFPVGIYFYLKESNQ